MSFRHSKIVCTIGPASRSPQMIERLMSAGMDVARLNFSHGTHEEHAKNISRLRGAAVEHEKPIAILADLSRKCAIDGLVEGLRRGEGSKGR